MSEGMMTMMGLLGLGLDDWDWEMGDDGMGDGR